MRLYASANTKENIGYTVSWIGFELEDVSYVFDLQGWQNYEPSGFDIMFKGDALPWSVIRGEEEIDLGELDEDELSELDIATIAEVLAQKPQITLGLSVEVGDGDMDVFDRWKLAQNDVFANKQLRIELPEGEYEFNDFCVEIAGE